MKYCKITAVLCAFEIALILSGCTLKKSETESKQNENSEEAVKMEKTERTFIKNEIAGDCPESYKEMREDVYYGGVLHPSYYSNTCKMERYLSILLPAGYDENKKYPVVYFQHGIFGDENCMVNDPANCFKEISANLAADGKAPEMIIVFGNMYATDDPAQKPGFDEKAVAPYDNYINELVNDIMPFVEKNYAVKEGRENTAICGFSMGGRESLYIGLQRPDLFGYIGAISPAPGLVPAHDWAMEHKGMLEESEVHFAEGAPLPKLFMLCCGTNDGTVGQFPKSYHNLLVKNNVDHVWFEVMGADHNADAIRSGLYYFLSNIF